MEPRNEIDQEINNFADALDRMLTQLDIVADDIKIGDVYSIHAGVPASEPSDYEAQSSPKRWNGNYKVIGFDGAEVVLENVDTGAIDSMRSEFLITWKRVKHAYD